MGNAVIYRPAYDAEVEYLESTGTQWIDTDLKASSELGILAHIYLPSAGIFPFGGRNGLTNKEFSFISRQSDFTAGFRFGSSESTNQLDLGEIYEFDNKQSHNTLKVNNLIFTSTSSTFISDYNLALFGLNHAGTVNPSSGVRIYDFKIYQNSTLVRDFIPVRIGQVGYMYDKVSKQLFANKGTGQFILGNDVVNAVIPQQRCVLYFGNQRSVGFERIYEEYEWLVGDGTARMWCVIGCNSAEWKLKGSGAASLDSHQYNEGGKAFQIVSDLQYIGGSGKIGIYDNSLTQYFSTTKFPINTIRLVMDTNVGSISINDTDFTNPDYTVSRYFELANQLRDKNSANVTYSMSAVKIDGSDRFYPCKLLQSIPAILDGNGIARQAGECGMWDKVSGRFYGNVANSGTFTVKGPKCYEEYKWLNQTIPIGVNTGRIPIPDGFEYTLKYSSIGNTPNITCSRHTYFSPSMTLIGIYNILDDGSASITNWTLVSLSELKVKDTGTSILFNDNELPRFNSSYLIVSSNANNGQEVTVRQLSAITVDGSVRYVPCKLTHGIPASMDANGIARPAGTCGMWDKVNDKFYGNVANSGSFTVSND